MEWIRRHITFANVVAVTALFVALSAGAYAAGLKKDSVKSKQIKDGAVTTSDLADDAVTGAKVLDRSVGGVDVTDDSITGAQIAEGSLRGVRAASADSVGGMQVKNIDYRANFGSNTVQTIVAFPGVFRIDAQCANFGDGFDITAFTAADNSIVAQSGYAPSTSPAVSTEEDGQEHIKSDGDFDFDSNEAFAVDNALPFGIRENVTINFATPNGFVVTVQVAVEESSGSCKMSGTAIGG